MGRFRRRAVREPTAIHAAYAWWRAALAGEKPPIHDGDPKPGFYRRRMVRHGPWVPVRIWLEQPVDGETGELTGDETLRCEVDGRAADPGHQWTYVAGQPISESDFNYMRQRAAWALRHAPDHPIANPNAPVDWDRAPIPF